MKLLCIQIDNRGNRLLAVDDSGINTPAIAAAHAVKRYTAQAADEISLEVGKTREPTYFIINFSCPCSEALARLVLDHFYTLPELIDL